MQHDENRTDDRRSDRVPAHQRLCVDVSRRTESRRGVVSRRALVSRRMESRRTESRRMESRRMESRRMESRRAASRRAARAARAESLSARARAALSVCAVAAARRAVESVRPPESAAGCDAATRRTESATARRAESVAARRASESPELATLRVAESTRATICQTFSMRCGERCDVSTMTEFTFAGFTDGCSKYVRVHPSAVLSSRRTTPIGMPRGKVPPSPDV